MRLSNAILLVLAQMLLRQVIMAYALGDERGKEEVMEKLDKAEEELNRSGQSAVSITDPEARFMKNKKERIELSYNSQITVDHDLEIILANDETERRRMAAKMRAKEEKEEHKMRKETVE